MKQPCRFLFVLIAMLLLLSGAFAEESFSGVYRLADQSAMDAAPFDVLVLHSDGTGEAYGSEAGLPKNLMDLGYIEDFFLWETENGRMCVSFDHESAWDAAVSDPNSLEFQTEDGVCSYVRTDDGRYFPPLVRLAADQWESGEWFDCTFSGDGTVDVGGRRAIYDFGRISLGQDIYFLQRSPWTIWGPGKMADEVPEALVISRTEDSITFLSDDVLTVYLHSREGGRYLLGRKEAQE
ncbi:MAG: hypothetical protein IJ083_01210 [Clostridia bacterium]|nr:hypothetical protein [Clostridia bacterium]